MTKVATVVFLGLAHAVWADPFPTSLPTDRDSIWWGASDYTGTIPTQVGLLTNLGTLALYDNSFTGPIPSQVGKLTKMSYYLAFEDNDLTSSLPTEFGLLTKMTTWFGLKSNAFTSSIPTEFGQLTGMKIQAWWEDCRLSGPLPTELGLLTNLYGWLYLRDNELTSHIPTQFGGMPLEKYITLSGNDFSGPLPSQVGLQTNMLQDVYWQNMGLTGSVPTQLAQWTAFTAQLYLSANEFCGDMPTELQALSAQLTAGWTVPTGNEFGTPCCETLPDTHTCVPTPFPTPLPTPIPTSQPTLLPTPLPTPSPSPQPTLLPTPQPTVVCGEGEYFIGSSNTCEPCQAGKYRSSSIPPAVCKTCPAGTYRAYSTDASSAVSCNDCPSGRLSAADRTACDECSAGEYAWNDTSCETCEAGRYAPTAQEDSCLECSAGFETNKDLGATSCDSCDAGMYSAAQSVNCSTCAVGKYSGSRSESCSNCSAGFFSDAPGASSCTACAAGFVAGSTGSSRCSACGQGTYQSATGQAECEECEAGKYADSVGSLSCSSCAVGKYSNASGGASTCEDCNPGTFSASGAASCSSCEAGKHSNASTDFACESCAAGLYSAEGAASCSKCSAGRHSDAGASSCKACEEGYYSDVEGATSCTACAAGFFTASTTSSNCSACGVGTYQSATGQDHCADCEPGKYADSTKSSSCTACNAGTHSNTSAQACTDCAAGTYSSVAASSCTACTAGTHSSTGASLCVACDAGTHSNASASNCTECDAGTYSSVAAASCTACSAGEYTDAPGSSSCIACAVGFVAEFSRSINCSACEVGKYQSATGQTACEDCDEGRFAANSGSSSCDKCSSEVGTEYTSTVGASRCERCVTGSYWDGDSCKTCPTHGVDCTEQGSTLSALEVEVGWFRFTPSSTAVYQCSFPTNCQGGRNTTNQCREGAHGPLCATCDANYYLDAFTLACTDCANVGRSDTMLIFVLVLALVFVMAVAWRARKAWRKAKAEGRTLDLSFSQDCCSVFITTTQTLTLLMSNHEDAGGEPAPGVYRRYMRLFEFVNFEILSFLPGVGCAFAGFEYDLFLTTGLFSLFVAATLAWWKHKSQQGDPNAWRLLKTAAWLCKLALPAVSQVICQTFRCQEYDGGDVKYLLADHSIDCRSSFYRGLVAYAAIMMLVFPVGMPLFALFELMRLRPHFNEFLSDEHGLHDHFEEHPVLSVSPISSLFKSVRPQFASWFEVADMGRRLILTCGTLLFSRAKSFILFSIFVAFTSFTLHEQLRPFDSRELNALVSVEHAQNLLCIIMMLMQDASMFEQSSFAIIGVVLLLTNLSMILVIIFALSPDRSQVQASTSQATSQVTHFLHEHHLDGGWLHLTKASHHRGHHHDLAKARSPVVAAEHDFAHTNPLHHSSTPGADDQKDEERGLELMTVELAPSPPVLPAASPSHRGRRSSISTIAAHQNRHSKVDLSTVGKRHDAVTVELAPSPPALPPSSPSRIGRRSSIGTITAHQNRHSKVNLSTVGKRHASTRTF